MTISYIHDQLSLNKIDSNKIASNTKRIRIRYQIIANALKYTLDYNFSVAIPLLVTTLLAKIINPLNI
jgi:hypothetical protein